MSRRTRFGLGGALLLSAFVACGKGDYAESARYDGVSAAAISGASTRGKMPSTQEIFSWIVDITKFGHRIPGTKADAATRRYLAAKMREIGLKNVRQELIGRDDGFLYWYAKSWRLSVDGAVMKSFYVPNTKHTGPQGVAGELVYVGERVDPGEDVRGKVVVADVRFGMLPGAILKGFSYAGHDPDDTVKNLLHPATWVRSNFEGRDYVTEEVDLGVYGEAFDGGAVAFIGVLKDYPIDTEKYYGPYEGYMKPMPGLWISGPDGASLAEKLSTATKPVLANVRLTGGFNETATTGNVIGELPGRTDDVIIIGSHHDAPWASATEDASGVAEVLALGKYYASLPRQSREKTMVFVLQAGHFYNSIGGKHYIAKHPDVIKRAVVELHLEHIAKDLDVVDGKWVDTGDVEVRGIFATGNPLLVDFSHDAIVKQDLRRTLILQTNSPLGVPGDGAMYWVAGLPVLHYISGPEWLFEPIDMPNTVAKDQLVPVARACVNMLDRVHTAPASLLKSFPPMPPPLPTPPAPAYPGRGVVYEGMGSVKTAGVRHSGRGALYVRPPYIDTIPQLGAHELVYLGVDGTSWLGPWKVLRKTTKGTVEILECEDARGVKLRAAQGANWFYAWNEDVALGGTSR